MNEGEEKKDLGEELRNSLLIKRDFECGRYVYFYKCAKCGDELKIKRQICKGLPMCYKCKRKVINEKRKKKLKENPRLKGFRFREINEIDFGMVGALYKAHRTIKWIADDQVTTEETIKEILRRLHAEGTI